MDFFSFNYKPKSFKGKTPEAILEMKPTKIDKNFFTKYNSENNEDYRELSPEMKGAIQLLIDLKSKIVIYNKCYKNSFQSERPRKQNTMKQRPEQERMPRPDPMPMQEQERMPRPEPMQELEQAGGSVRRSKRKTKSKAIRKGKLRVKRTRKH
jgi:hypothetical protein